MSRALHYCSPYGMLSIDLNNGNSNTNIVNLGTYELIFIHSSRFTDSIGLIVSFVF